MLENDFHQGRGILRLNLSGVLQLEMWDRRSPLAPWLKWSCSSCKEQTWVRYLATKLCTVQICDVSNFQLLQAGSLSTWVG